MSISNYNVRELSRDAITFAQQVARSIVEIQPEINNVADVVIFLEILGYSENIVTQKGFKDIHDLARYIYNFIDAYEDHSQKNRNLEIFQLVVPTIKQRLIESLTMNFQWIGALLVLYLVGVSLWLETGLPNAETTAFLIGVFLSILITEGILQTSYRLFRFYDDQRNITEVNRLLKRIYSLIAIILPVALGIMYAIALYEKIPSDLIFISASITTMLSLHRISYVVIYSQKKIGQIIMSYTAAFSAFLSFYFLLDNLIPIPSERFLLGTFIGFCILSIFAAYNNYKTLARKPLSVIKGEKPSIFKPANIAETTMRSRFGIQLWENFLYFLFGTFFFAMLYTDRVIAWNFNPIHTNGLDLPMSFNMLYHSGADPALLVLFPAILAQSVIIGSTYEQIKNMVCKLKISEVKIVDRFFHLRYTQILIASLIISIIAAIVVNFTVPVIIHSTSNWPFSSGVLALASISNILLSIFVANSLFLMLMNKVKILVILAIISTSIVAVVGSILGQTGVENIIIAYFISATFASLSSLFYIRRIFSKVSSLFFSKFV